MQQPPWLAHAWPETGTREVAGPRSNPRIARLFADAGFPSVSSDETAWCAAFVGACLARGGAAASGSLLARSYLDWGEPIDAFRLGAVAVFPRGGDPATGHVGFAVGESDTAIYLLGGNQGDQVSVEAFPKARLLGLRWPGRRPEAEITEPPAGPDDTHSAGSEPSFDASFDAALAHVLEMEGGWTEDPHDPGGPTNQGITLGVYAAVRGVTLDATNTAAMKEELRRIPEGTVREIYHRRYWRLSAADTLPDAIAFMHFDAAVNHGVGAAARFLQEAAGVDVDGEIGPQTRAAVAEAPVATLLERYAEIRRARYRRLPHFWRFGRGWLRRADLTLSRALERAGAGAAGPGNSTTSNPTKGPHPMPNEQPMQSQLPAQPKWWGQSMTIWGAVVTAMATVIPVLGPLIGVEIPAEVIRHAGSQAGQVLQAVAGLVGTALTIWGRIRATQPLIRRDVSLRI